MRRLAQVLLVVCLLGSAGLARAEVSGFFEVQSMTPEVTDRLTFDGGLSIPLKYGLGLRTFFLVTSGFAQGHIGPTWQPLPWLKIGASIGAQQAPDGLDLRTSYLLWLGHGQFSFCGMVEVGEKAYQGDDAYVWYDLNVRVKVTDWLTLGVKDRRPAGVGPLAELTIPRIKLTGWFAWVPFGAEKAEFVSERFLAGLKLGF